MWKLLLFIIICANITYALNNHSTQLTESQKEICQSVKSVKVIVNQDYGKDVKKDLPFKKEAKIYLSKYTNLLIADDTTSCDAILKINVKGHVLTAKYGRTLVSSSKQIQYSGAKFEGDFSYDISGTTFYKGTFDGRFDPPVQIQGSYNIPSSAPFEEAYKNSTFAAELIKMIGMIYGIEPVISALKDREKKVRLSAVKTCVILNDLRAVEPLMMLLKDRNFEVKGNVIDALGELKDPRAVPVLCSELNDSPFRVASALGKIDHPSAIKPLIDQLKIVNNKNYSKRIGEVLNKITGKNFKTNYEKWLKWWEENKNDYERL